MTTRDTIDRFVEARAKGLEATIAGLLTEDAVWRPPPSAGIGPFNGRAEVAAALAGGAAGRNLDTSTIERDVRKVIVDGDTAVVLQRMTATTLGGADYANDYCWVCVCDGAGLIAEIDEYVDTLHAARVFGWV